MVQALGWVFSLEGGWQMNIPYLLVKVKEESGKPGLKPNIQKTKIMASGPTISWQIGGKKWKHWQISLGSKINVDCDCSHEIKKCLLLGRIAMTSLHSILPRKVPIVKATVFPVVMYRYKSGMIKKAECWTMMLLNCGAGEDSWESLG